MEKGNKNKANQTASKSKEKEYELSEEAKIGPDEKKHIKKIGETRAIVSKDPKFKEDEDEETEYSEERKTPGKDQTDQKEIPKPEKTEDSLPSKEENEKQPKLKKKEDSIQPTEENEGEKKQKTIAEESEESVLTKEENRKEPKTQKSRDSSLPTREKKKQNTKHPAKSEIKQKGSSDINLTVKKLVNLLASYGVPLDKPVRNLIREIKQKGKLHIQKELEE